MGALNSRGDLAIAEIAFFSPAFVIGLAINIKQGFTGGVSWIYLVTLCILRLIGASCTLYMESQNDYSQSLEETAFITSAIGTMPLLLVLLGILERLHPRMGPAGLPQIVFRAIHLIGLAALVLSIVGGTKVQSSDTSSHNTGKDCLEAGSIIFLAIYVGLALLTILTAFRGKAIPSAEKVLIFAGVGVLPALCVRIVYTVATSWSSSGSIFYYLTPSVVVQALMQFAMEAIAIVIYSWGGLTAPKAQPCFRWDERTGEPLSWGDPTEELGQAFAGLGFERTEEQPS
ncbi:hypothetical protein M409DRAFT_70316 [Zasmidium cellare ATCC 36951]|uniref:DUF7702 domain-containing protein n=1 Tax=Zasmidium cellare ATCC 36951 TaxID=1080233 RepID=A0A6A6C2Z7_ZASCE|nr:uncharacterized protein M409DRAFT_70316 [Zasmidium cellare ATCC 36951]KAF2160560.1 hypothetical protein M409DRAFT_70316 [Zasmidium cellare ATCC 36951]